MFLRHRAVCVVGMWIEIMYLVLVRLAAQAVICLPVDEVYTPALLRYVYSHVYSHVCRHVYRHVYGHECRPTIQSLTWEV